MDLHLVYLFNLSQRFRGVLQSCLNQCCDKDGAPIYLMVSGGGGGKGGGGVWSWNGWVLCTIMVVQFVRSQCSKSSGICT